MSAEHIRDMLARGTAADAVAKLLRSSGLTSEQIAAVGELVRHTPHAASQAGLALAHGGRVRGVVGSSQDQGFGDHLDHAVDHLAVALEDAHAKTDTGLRELDHAVARLLLAGEVLP